MAQGLDAAPVDSQYVPVCSGGGEGAGGEGEGGLVPEEVQVRQYAPVTQLERVAAEQVEPTV